MRALLRRACDRAADTAAVFLADTLDWLNLWHDNTAGLEEEQPAPAPNHLFPHL